jgi:cysteine desulfurase
LPEIYLDNSATTFLHPEVAELICRVQNENYGNPSSLHEKGIEAERLLFEARLRIARTMRNSQDEIIFTSGGTEANNLAIIGAARRNKHKGRHLLTSVSEHPSVLNCFQALEKEGFQVTYLPVDRAGTVDPEELITKVRQESILVSIMHVNNEIGTIQPLQAIGQALKRKNPAVLFHVDAVQSFTKLPLDCQTWQADLVTVSSHKIHGPKGAGCLWVKRGVLLEPIIHGGGQEKGMRSGTENTAALAGFGLAAALSGTDLSSKNEYLTGLKTTFLQEIENSAITYDLNGPPSELGVPHILNLAFPGIKAEVLLHFLEEKGIFVSAGSACHSRHSEPSHVLKAINLKKEFLEGSIRFSFSIYNNEAEVLTAAKETVTAVNTLRSMLH